MVSTCELGFYIDAGARVRVLRNRVVGLAPEHVDDPRPGAMLTGIQATIDHLVLKGNVVLGAIQGITLDGDDILIAGNTVRRNRPFGLWIEVSTWGEVRRNVVRDNGGRGIAVGGYEDWASGMSIHDNDARGNDLVDCRDWTSGSGTAGTANIWRNNLGDESRPDRICSPGTLLRAGGPS
jgi:hypothetical protein